MLEGSAENMTENRDSWTITPQETRMVQGQLLKMMREVVSVCAKHDIHYYLVEGTLLGAVRHQGFIPWDDDADIAIPVEEMASFIDHCMKELPKKFYIRPFFRELGTDKEKTKQEKACSHKKCAMLSSSVEYVPDLTRICDRTFQIIDQSGKHMDLYVDIPVLIGLPKNKLQRVIYYNILTLKKNLVRVSRPELIQTNYWSNKTPFRRIVIWLLKKVDFSRVLSYEKRLNSLEKWLRKYPVKDSKYVFLYPTAYRSREIVPRDWYGDGISVTFEDVPVRIPKEYDKILTAIYGNYKQLPPKKKRKPSHVIRIDVRERQQS